MALPLAHDWQSTSVVQTMAKHKRNTALSMCTGMASKHNNDGKQAWSRSGNDGANKLRNDARRMMAKLTTASTHVCANNQRWQQAGADEKKRMDTCPGMASQTHPSVTPQAWNRP
jgi:predicted Rdx family selenoprotein